MPVTTSPQAQIVAAVGAGLLAGRDPEEEVVTRIAATPVAAAPLAAASVAPAPLAWSADEGPDDLESAFDDARPEILFSHSDFGGAEGFAPLPWYRRPGVLFGAAACLAVVASVGFVLTVRSDDLGTVPAGSAGTSTSVAPPVASQPLAGSRSASARRANSGSAARCPDAVGQRTRARPGAPAGAPGGATTATGCGGTGCRGSAARGARSRTAPACRAGSCPTPCGAGARSTTARRAGSCGPTACRAGARSRTCRAAARRAAARSRPRDFGPWHCGPRHDGPGNHRSGYNRSRHDGPGTADPARRTPELRTRARRTRARPTRARRSRARQSRAPAADEPACVPAPGAAC